MVMVKPNLCWSCLANHRKDIRWPSAGSGSITMTLYDAVYLPIVCKSAYSCWGGWVRGGVCVCGAGGEGFKC